MSKRRKDSYYMAAQVPHGTKALILALDDEGMRDIAMGALHSRFVELARLYDDGPGPGQGWADWASGRAWYAAIEREADTIREAAQQHGFASCQEAPLCCARGCWS